MASLKTVLFLGVCLSARIVVTAGENFGHPVKNVQWLSLDFKTVLVWTTEDSDHTYLYNVLYFTEADTERTHARDCIEISEVECDLTESLWPFDRTYSADIITLSTHLEPDYDPDELPHTTSPSFNPYSQSNISAVEFTVSSVDERTVSVNITDTVTSVRQRGKQLTIRDILQKDLKYKISYYKSGNTGKRDVISDSSVREISELDPGQSYCFMIAAYIPSRPRASQQGAWSKQWCMEGNTTVLQELSVGAWVGAVFIFLTVLVIIATVSVLCYRRHQQRYETMQTPQASGPV